MIRLDGAVEISVQLGVADAIADVVGSGRTLRQHGLAAFGDTICASEAVVITQAERALTPAARQVVSRLRGVVLAQQYLMLDYDCPRELMERAIAITPGLESPTVAPLADPAWAAVRAAGAVVARRVRMASVRSAAVSVGPVMDALVELGARAILASDIRSCRL